MTDQAQPNGELIALQLPAEVVQMCLQALSTQPYRVVVNAINLLTEQYEAHRQGAAPDVTPAKPPRRKRGAGKAPATPPAGA